MRNSLRTVLSYVRQDQLPPDWDFTSVGDVVSDAQYGMNVPSTYDGETLIVGMKDIKAGRVLFDDLARTTVTDSELETYRLRGGDLLINRTNSLDQVGKVGIVDADRAIVFASYLVRLSVDRSKIEPEFLNLWLNSGLAQRTIKRIATPAIGQANLNPTEFQKYCLLPLPPIAEQKRIVEFLRIWDQAIGNTEILLAAKKKRLSWLRMNLLTGKRRLPGHKADWSTLRLREILTEHGLKSSGAEEVFSVSVHKGLINQIDHLGRSYAAQATSHYNRVMPGDIVYTKSPTGDFPLGIIKQARIDRSVIVSPLYGVFTPVNPYIGALLDAFFESQVNTKNYLAPLVQKGAKNTIAITNKRFLDGRLRIPTDETEQAALAGIVSAARIEISVLQRQIEALVRQKRGLVQRLLIGKWRVRPRGNGVDKSTQRAAQQVVA